MAPSQWHGEGPLSKPFCAEVVGWAVCTLCWTDPSIKKSDLGKVRIGEFTNVVGCLAGPHPEAFTSGLA